MKYGMEDFSMKWKWNGRKLQARNMEKSSSIPYHALPEALPTAGTIINAAY